MVLDHLRRHLGERHRVAAMTAAIAGHIQDAKQLTEWVENRHARTREEPVRAQVMLVAEHHGGIARGNGGADSVSALLLLAPQRTGPQCDTIGTGEEIVVA